MEQITPLLTVGAQFEMSGCPFEVAGIHRDEIRIAPIKGGTVRHMKFRALDQLIDNDAINITYTPPNSSEHTRAELRSSLNATQLEKLNRQLRWVHEIHARIPHSPCSQPAIAKVMKDMNLSPGKNGAPCTSSIAAWMKRWIRGGRSDVALMPKPRPSRSAYCKLDKELAAHIDAAIRSTYLTRQRNPMSAVYAEVMLQVANHNAVSETKLSMPSKETIRRIINRLDQCERDERRHGKHYAQRMHRAAGASFVARVPLDLCMADGKVMDIILIEPPRDDGKPQEALGRPFLTVIIDVRTRCILAAYVSFAPFSAATLLKTMSIAVVAAPGQPRGIMRKLLVDNGSDYLDSGFSRFCVQLDIQLEPCPPKMPNGKAIVERFFRTMDEDLIRKLPGTTFSNPDDRGDYDSQSYARVTLKELQGHVETWIREFYHQTPHRALGRAPMAVWNDEAMP